MTTSTRIASLETALGNELLLAHLSGEERLGHGFAYDLELLAVRPDIAPLELLGTAASVKLRTRDGERHLHGIIAHFACTGHASASGRFTEYRAQLRPTLWTLSHTTDSRVFQHKSVPEVLEEVFHAFGVTDLEFALGASYPKREYLVQYQETTYNFVHRLMEREGIYYFFRHEADRHVLIVTDSVSGHDPMSGYETVEFFSAGQAGRSDSEHLSSWQLHSEVRPGRYTLTDFDFRRPTANLSASHSGPKGHPYDDGAIYEYPGGYLQTTEGEAYARLRLERFQADHEVASGDGNVRGMAAGNLFTLEGHPQSSRNREYLIVRVVHDLDQGAYESGDVSAAGYHCRIEAIEAGLPYRMQTGAKQPSVRGPQTATVVTEGVEDITTDEFGRVKVQFHWDREGERDHNSSCFVRVAQIWAGNGFGGQFIPRKDQEVIVDFLEGDPDRPIITGCVYNADNMPPYAVPDHRTQSGFKTRSIPGGAADNYNEVRFEDKKGEEELTLHAERNLSVTSKQASSYSVGTDMTRSVGNNHSRTVGADETLSVDGNQELSIKGSRTKTVDTDETNTVSGNRTSTVTGDETVDVGPRTETVHGDETIAVQGNRNVTVEANDTNATTDTYTLSAKEIAISASQKLTITVGAAELTLESSGAVTLNGTQIAVDGATVGVSGSGEVTVSAVGPLTLSGAMVKIN